MSPKLKRKENRERKQTQKVMKKEKMRCCNIKRLGEKFRINNRFWLKCIEFYNIMCKNFFLVKHDICMTVIKFNELVL